MSHAATSRTVRPATMESVPGVARVLGHAFREDPLYRWLFPDPVTRRARTVRLHALLAGFAYVPEGVVDVVEDQVEEPPHTVVRAAAWWDAPGRDVESGTAFLLRSLPHLAGMIGFSRLLEAARYFIHVDEARPIEPHWYLAALGTDPVAQGTGAGSALMRAGLERADADGVPVHLETMNPDNLDFYERHGFRVTHVMDETDTPTAYSMLRPAGG